MNRAPLIALVGNPNAGKSALFNALTGARQKVGNYPGVTVERRSGRVMLTEAMTAELVDLPGAYSLDPNSPDERVTRDVILGRQVGERAPDALVIVLDASNLDNHLGFALELVALGKPVVVALNMVDLAERDGLVLDAAALSRELGVPVVETVAVRKRGLDALRALVSRAVDDVSDPAAMAGVAAQAIVPNDDITARQRRARAIARRAIVSETPTRRLTHMLDAVALHPVWGTLLLLGILFLMFQAVFTWAKAPADALDSGFGALSALISSSLPPGFLRGLLTEGIIAGVGAVIVFLPQILILFLFILLLEASGYMVRAAFLMDRVMAIAGLSGRAFIPLLSSFACAVPGIMATRTIDDEKDRLTTILIAPLMTCSARLPVYTIVIGALIPNRALLPLIGLQGLVLFALYVFGIVGAFVAALVLRRTVTRGASSGFMMEMPKYQLPRIRDVALGLWSRTYNFLRRAGTIILASTLVLWLLLSYPKPPAGSAVSPIDYSVAGRLANGVAVVTKPIGFDRDIALALIPAMAAREIAVAALGTVYAIGGTDDARGQAAITKALQLRWSLPTALAFLMWFVFAPQCISTIAVTRRETNSWAWPAFMVGYLFALAYAAAGATYWAAMALGL